MGATRRVSISVNLLAFVCLRKIDADGSQLAIGDFAKTPGSESDGCIGHPWPIILRLCNELALENDGRLLDELALEFHEVTSPRCYGEQLEESKFCRYYDRLSELLASRSRVVQQLGPDFASFVEFSALPFFSNCMLGATALRLLHIYVTDRPAAIRSSVFNVRSAPLAEEAVILRRGLVAGSPWSPVVIAIMQRLQQVALRDFVVDVHKPDLLTPILETLVTRSADAWSSMLPDALKASRSMNEVYINGSENVDVGVASLKHLLPQSPSLSGPSWELCAGRTRTQTLSVSGFLDGMIAVVAGAFLAEDGQVEIAVNVFDTLRQTEVCNNWPGTHFLPMGCGLAGQSEHVAASVLSSTAWKAGQAIRGNVPPFSYRPSSIAHCNLTLGSASRNESVVVNFYIADAVIELELCRTPTSPRNQLAVCTRPLYDIWSRPEAFLHFAEYHGTMLNASLVLYDLDGSLNFVKDALPAGAEIFSYFADMISPAMADVSRGSGMYYIPFVDCTIPLAEAHCLFRQRSRADWVFFSDAPDNYLMVRPPGGPESFAAAVSQLRPNTAAAHLLLADFGGPQSSPGTPDGLLPPYAMFLHHRELSDTKLSPWRRNRTRHFVPWSALCRPALCISKHGHSVRARWPYNTEFMDPSLMRVNHYVDLYSRRLRVQHYREDRGMLWALRAGARCWSSTAQVHGERRQEIGLARPQTGIEQFDRKSISVASLSRGADLRPPISLRRFLKMFDAERHTASNMLFTDRIVQLFTLHRYGVRLEVESKDALMSRFQASDRDGDGLLSLDELLVLLESAGRDVRSNLPQSCCGHVVCDTSLVFADNMTRD